MSAKIGSIAGFFADGVARPDAGSTLNLAVIGASGRVGRRLLELLASRRAALASSGVHLRLVAVANSRASVVASEGLPLEQAVARLLATRPGAEPTLADA